MDADPIERAVVITATTMQEADRSHVSVDLEAHHDGKGCIEPPVWSKTLTVDLRASKTWSRDAADEILAAHDFHRVGDWVETDCGCRWETTVVERPLAPAIPIPEEFAEAFIALANTELNDPDPLDLDVSDDRLRLYLPTSCPGPSPYVQLSPQGNEVVVASRAVVISGPQENGGQWGTKTVTPATAVVDMTDPQDFAQKALDCWMSSL